MKPEKILAIVLIFASFLFYLFRSPFSPYQTTTYPQNNELASEKYVNFIKMQNGKYNYLSPEALFHEQKFTAPLPLAKLTKTEPSNILGVSREDDKWIEIDLSEQKLYAHEGDRIIYEFLVSTGKWAPTPTGEFRIWTKLRYTTMKGGDKSIGTYYYLPNVPYTMFFYKGYGIHGTYWHNNFGQPMSHGCVNLSISDAEKLFWWAKPVLPEGKSVINSKTENPGTRVVIHE